MHPILKATVLFVLVGVLGIAGIFAAAWMWPLPKGEGFAFVAHPVWALIGCGLVAVAGSVACFVYPHAWGWWLAASLAATWAISALIFLSA